MPNRPRATPHGTRWRLLFRPSSGDACAMEFPCTAGGAIDFAALSPSLLKEYLRVRRLVGSAFHSPVVVQAAPRDTQ